VRLTMCNLAMLSFDFSAKTPAVNIASEQMTGP
jgi:hypothetical protein